MRFNIFASGLSLALGLAGVGTIGVADVVVAQQQATEIDAAVAEGTRLFKEGNAESLKKATIVYERLFELARVAKIVNKQALSLLALGRISDLLGNKQKAIGYYEQSLQLSQITGDQSGQATLFNNIGDIYGRVGNQQKALDYFNQSLILYHSIGNDQSGEARTLNNIGGVYHTVGDRQKALEYFNRSLVIYQSLGDTLGESTSLNNTGLVYSKMGDKETALEYYDKSLLLSRTLGQQQAKQASTIDNIGNIYASWGDTQKALNYYNEALSLYNSVEDLSGQAISLNNIGGIYDSSGDKQKALDYYNRSIPLSRAALDQAGEARTLNNIGSVYVDLGENKRAIDYYNKALDLCSAANDRPCEAIAFNNIGATHEAMGEYQTASRYYNQSLALYRAVSNQSGEATSFNNIAAIYDSSGEKQKAIDYYNKSLALYRSLRNPLGEATTLNNIGFLYDSMDKKQLALDHYSQSLSLWRSVGHQSGEALTLNNIGLILKDRKQPELAIAVFKQSVNIYESIRKGNEKLPLELQKSYVKKISYTYQALANLLIKQGRLPEAQAVLELLKFKELREYTREAKTTTRIGISFTPAEQKALDEIFTTYSTAANFSRQISECAEQKCPQLTQLQADRDRSNTIIREMLDRLQKTLKDQVIDLSKLNTNELNDAARKIVNTQPGTILIYPIVTETKIQFLIALKAGDGDDSPVTFRAIDGPTIKSEDLFKTTNEFRNALLSPDSNLQTLQILSQQLYTILIKPLEPEINQLDPKTNQPYIKHLVFATDRATRHIPLAALHDGKEYLINKPYSLSTILAAAATQPAARPPTSPKVLALGASQFKNANALNFVEQETNAIVQTLENPSGIFPGDRYLNTQFNFATLQTKLDGHNILHIATHGILDPTNIDNSYLLTSSGEKITKREITKLQDYGLSNIHLVILSACNTGTGGKNTEGLEIAGISHYFMRDGGAKSVIASLWQVNDPATALFMQQFYKHLKTGMTKAQAIQKVQQDLIQAKLTLKEAEALPRAGARRYLEGQLPVNSLAHPYYWAPFILIGNNQ